MVTPKKMEKKEDLNKCSQCFRKRDLANMIAITICPKCLKPFCLLDGPCWSKHIVDYKLGVFKCNQERTIHDKAWWELTSRNRTRGQKWKPKYLEDILN